MNNSSYPWYLSWPAIIVAFIFFWPAALVLIYLRTKNSKSDIFAAASNKKVYIVLGVLLILMGLGNIASSALMGIFMIVGGAAVIYYANTLAKKATRNKTYIDLIVNQGETSIDKIASMLNVKYDVALKELQTMKTLGVLKNAQINANTHTVTVEKPVNTQNSLQNNLQNSFGQITGAVNEVTDALTGAASTSAATTVSCACPGCGAKYTGVQGNSLTCDYCDTTFVLK